MRIKRVRTNGAVVRYGNQLAIEPGWRQTLDRRNLRKRWQPGGRDCGSIACVWLL